VKKARGFAPDPTSFFALMQRTKQEKSRQNDPSPLCRKAGISNKVSQAPLLKFQALRHSLLVGIAFCPGQPTAH